MRMQVFVSVWESEEFLAALTMVPLPMPTAMAAPQPIIMVPDITHRMPTATGEGIIAEDIAITPVPIPIIKRNTTNRGYIPIGTELLSAYLLQLWLRH